MTGLPPFHQRVRDEWIDYNGHLSEAYYVLMFGYATDAVMDRIGLDERYRSETGCSLYTVDAHVRYLREVTAGSEVTITSTVLEAGEKKLRLYHEMAVRDTVVSTEEIVAVHVHTGEGKAKPLPSRVRAHELVRRA